MFTGKPGEVHVSNWLPSVCTSPGFAVFTIPGLFTFREDFSLQMLNRLTMLPSEMDPNEWLATHSKNLSHELKDPWVHLHLPVPTDA
jgi:hypothetical protein